MRTLALDIGSSSVKAAVFTDWAMTSGPVRVPYPTRFDGVRAEIEPAVLWAAVVNAVRPLDVDPDVVAVATLGPAWVALDRAGRPLTNLVTHADRRSLAQARALEATIGADRHLRLAGNRPYPGGIASTTWRWMADHHPGLTAQADLVGSVTTWLHRVLTGERMIDPSHASFLGVYDTVGLGGWVPELVEAVGARIEQLPEVRDAAAPAGLVTAEAAAQLGIRPGTPVLTGCLDGSAAMLAAGVAAGGLQPGQLVNVVGSTDVLAILTGTPAPAPGLLTRALGSGRRWVAVATLASAGSALDWAHRTLFAELPPARFHELIAAAAADPDPGSTTFTPHLSGDRTAVEQPTAAFAGLTLATTREQMLSAIIESLATAGAERVSRLAAVAPPKPTVYVTGGALQALAPVLHRDWPTTHRWTYRALEEATSAGLVSLATTWANGVKSA